MACAPGSSGVGVFSAGLLPSWVSGPISTGDSTVGYNSTSVLTKLGNGTLELGGVLPNTYPAGTIIAQGTLLANKTDDGNPNTSFSASGQFVGVDQNLGFVTLMLASIFFMIGIFLAVRFVHSRPLRTLITPAPSIAWGRFFQGFGTWFLLSALISIVEALTHPGRYLWTPSLVWIMAVTDLLIGGAYLGIVFFLVLVVAAFRMKL